jgi:hypothetical protein
VKESDLNSACSTHIQKMCVGAVIYKHADKFTAGIPDTSVTWRGTTSWLEFKLLRRPADNVIKLLSKVQLHELVKLEHAGHAWVIAFRAKPHQTLIYRPGALVGLQDAPASREKTSIEGVREVLKWTGVAMFEGFNYNAIAALIHLTHE